MARILIDTRLWALSLKVPFLAEHDPVLEQAVKARNFVSSVLENDDLLFSSQLVAEIYHVLTQAGNEIPDDQARRLIGDLLERRGTIYRPISEAVLNQCMDLSARSGIHLTDYLVVYPFEDVIDRIYTMDPHFQHASLMSVALIENPLGIWRTEDQEL